MPRTSNKAELIMDYVNEFIQENGYSPSVREIGAAVGLRSTASVSYHLQALQDKGLLQSPGAKGRKRAIVTGARPGQIPVVGVVTAGMPILAVENYEGYIDFPRPSRTHTAGDLYALRIQGESMIEAGMLDGDLIVVEKSCTAEDGDIIVALVEDEATVKTFYRDGNRFRLQPENSAMEPIYVDELLVLGKVVACMRFYK